MKFIYILTDQKGVFIRATDSKEWTITLAEQRLREWLYKHPNDEITLKSANIRGHIESMERAWKNPKDPMLYTLHTTDCRTYRIYLQSIE